MNESPVVTAIRERCFVDPATECWHWRAATNSRGSPYLHDPTTGRSRNVRSWLFELETGRPLGRRHVYAPRCGSEDCVCPSHQCVRSRSSLMKGLPKAPSRARLESRRARAKLNPEAVAVIHASREPHHVLAERFGVHKKTIREVRLGRSWTDQAPSSSIFALGGNR